MRCADLELQSRKNKIKEKKSKQDKHGNNFHGIWDAVILCTLYCSYSRTGSPLIHMQLCHSLINTYSGLSRVLCEDKLPVLGAHKWGRLASV